MRKGVRSILVTLIATLVFFIWHAGTQADVLPNVAAAMPVSTSGISIPVDPCEEKNKSNWREYKVAAIDVKMVLNRFGDRDDDAFMYVLDQHVLDEKRNKVKEWQNQPGCTSWDQPGGHKPCVSTGLRDDLVQPLVLRTNLGQCLVIHFTNRLKVDKLLDPNSQCDPETELRENKVKCLDGTTGRKWPIDRISNSQFVTKAALQIDGLAYSVERAGKRVRAIDAFAAENETITYKIPLPSDKAAERAYYFHDAGGNRQRVPHGLFGVIVAEPEGSKYLDPKTGHLSDGTGWEAIIDTPPGQRDFREFVLIYHEVGDETYDKIVDGTGKFWRFDEDTGKFSTGFLPQITSKFAPLELTYRPAGRALNYRSEPFLHRLTINSDPPTEFRDNSPFAQKKALAYSSYTFGDPATPIPRSYLGEPTKTRLVHGGSEVFHVHHLHGGGDRWRRNPKADPNNDIASGLNKRPMQNVLSTHLDSQTIGPGTSYNLEHECGAGGCQRAAGDFLYHCHIGHHYIGGMWSLWRVFDTRQDDLAKLPDMRDPPKALEDSTELVGKTFEGKTVVLEAKDPHQISLREWVESQLPPQGKRLDDDDATVWDWTFEERNGLPLYLGEPEITKEEKWANYESPTPGERLPIRFNPINGRYAWPLFRPHLGQRPPFAPNGHSGAPWLGEQVSEERRSEERRDWLCPDPQQWGIPQQTIRHYPISAVPVDVPRMDIPKNEVGNIDRDGKIFVLNEDIRGETPDGKVLFAKSKNIEPLVIRSNVGDCVRIIFTNRLKDTFDPETGTLTTLSKVNMHTHFVQFDPQASDGVITGFSFEQSVRPYNTERPSGTEQGRQLMAKVWPGEKAIVVNQTYRLRANGQARKGVWIGIGLGEGVLDTRNSCCAPKPGGMVPRTEIRRVEDIVGLSDGTFKIMLDRPLELPHEAGEAVGVEFVQYLWYSDVDTGTVFWHDHVDFKSWGHGLASAHVIEPESSTWHDPRTGKPIRSGAIADIHTPSDSSVGAGQQGSFREFVLFNIKEQLFSESFGGEGVVRRKPTINLRAEPIVDPRSTFPQPGRTGSPAYWFSSVKHGDPATPIPRAYVGDPFVVRHLGVLDREGGIRITGHRFRLERFAPEGAFSDGSPIGISERYDLVLDGGAGGPPPGKPGDFLYSTTIGRDMLDGAWGLIRVHDRWQDDLKPLPDRRSPPRGEGFPRQTAKKKGTSGITPESAPGPGYPCPAGATERPYEVHIRKTEIVPQSRLKDLPNKRTREELTFKGGIVYSLRGQPEDYSIEPLVLRVNHGECLVVELHNDLCPQQPCVDTDLKRASLHVGELLFDPQGSHGAAIGLNLDSTVAPGESRTYRYFADQELGTTIAFNLANPEDAGKGAFAAVIVEPKGSEYRDIVTGNRIETGVLADIVSPTQRFQKFREIVTLFHDSDPSLGQNAMQYSWEAHCAPGGSGPEFCTRFPPLTSVSYKLDPWRLRNSQEAPADVYNSKLPLEDPHGDPGLVIAGPPGLRLTFRVAAPWGEQLHSFSLSGHRWPLEPDMHRSQQICRSKPKQMCRSEEVFAHLLAPGYAFDAPVIGGFGGEYGKTGDFLFFDARMPFTQAGLWGFIRVESKDGRDDR